MKIRVILEVDQASGYVYHCGTIVERETGHVEDTSYASHFDNTKRYVLLAELPDPVPVTKINATATEELK